MNPQQLQKYAQLAVKTGINLQKGQLLILSCPVETYEFGRILVEEAYKAGASNVIVQYEDDHVEKSYFLHASDEAIDQIPAWKVAQYEEWDNAGAAYLHILTEIPDVFADVPSERVSRHNRASRTALKFHNVKIPTFQVRWGFCVVPNPFWAQKVFPDLSEDAAMESLWNAILVACRADGENPIQAWIDHGKAFESRLKFLNDTQFDTLHFTNRQGTNLRMALPLNHVYIGGAVNDVNGIPLWPNIPTEEIFTAPLKTSVEGKLIGSKPLIYGGVVIDNFSLTFEKGRIVDFSAEKGFDMLKSLIETEDATHYLGEIALVSNQSPLAKSDILFYNTLIDENTACHIGIGNASPSNIQNGSQMTEAEREAVGLNVAILLVNATFGTDDMRVVGIKGGVETLIMENGDFVI